MKIVLALASLFTLSGLPPFGRSTAVSSRLDSIPSHHRYQVKLDSDSSPNKKQWSTLFIYPAKTRPRNEISLPVGFNQTTIQISSGDRVLQVDEDYVFIPDANRIRVLDEDALTSPLPIKITYEGVANPVYKRLTLGYRP